MYRGQKNRLSVIVIPEGHHGVRRWDIRRSWLKLGVVAVGIGAVGWCLALGGLYHYWCAYRATQSIRVENAQYDQERSALVSKLTSLEQAVERADRLTKRLETAAGVQAKAMTRGIGPITEEAALPTIPSLSEFRQFKLSAAGEKHSEQFAFNDLAVSMDRLRSTAGQIEERLQKVYEVRQAKTSFWAALPSLWPVRGFVTSGFGYRHATHVGGTRFHEGIDIASPIGTPVMATGDGVVKYAGYRGGFGKMVVVDHGFGISTVYGHNAAIYVAEGQRVRRGTVLSAIGMTGRTSGPHVHYEVLVDGVPVDPMRYLGHR